jgi:predicted phage terminase large subunit-like protein
MIDACHVARAPALTRIVVAIDPSGGGKAGNDEAGIMVAGLGHDQRFYVLDDLSGRMSPIAWAERAIRAYHHHSADRIVAERNFGGDMVAEVLRQVDPDVPLSLVHATRGKLIRAEPIAALYEQGRVSHVGRMIALEDELTTWVPSARRSPNRLDALVWALSALIPNAAGRAGSFTFG